MSHPSAERLDAFADDRVSGTARRRVAAHLAECARCRAAVQGARDLRARARGAGTPGFDGDAILGGALARRAEGERVAIDAGPFAIEGTTGARGHRLRVGVAVGIAASLVLLAGGSPALRRMMGDAGRSSTLTGGHACTASARHEEEGMSVTRMLRVLVVGPVLAAVGGCTEDRATGAPVVTAFDGTRLKPATMRYEVQAYVGETPTGHVSAYRTHVARTTLDGDDVWVQLLPRRRATMPGGGRTGRAEDGDFTDSVYYDLRTMTPRRSVAAGRREGRWVAETRDGFVRLVEAPSYLRNADESDRGRASMRRLIERQMTEPAPVRRAAGATVGPAQLELLTPGLPLTAEWRGALDILPIAPVVLENLFGRAPMQEPLRLAVTGTRTVTTPAGTFDAWVLRGTASDGLPKDGSRPIAVEVWVDRKDGWLLRVEGVRRDQDGDPWVSRTTLVGLEVDGGGR